MSYINFAKANCKNCYKCVRVCPVKAIKINNDQAEIVEDYCITCGRCLLNCPQNAKTINSDRELVKSFIKSKQITIASLAPSFAGAFNFAPFKIVTALRKLGFDYIGETSVGADIISKSYTKIYNSDDWDIAITTACPSVNLYFQKYHHDMLKYLLPVASPMEAYGRYIREKHGKESKVVFIGPCLAKKAEANNSQSVDAVLTFEDISEWIKESNIDVDDLDETMFDDMSTGMASLYPVPGLSIKSLNNTDKKRTLITVNGFDEINELINAINSGKLKNCWVEATACDGGCLNGPGMPKDSNVFAIKQKILKYLQIKQTLNMNHKPEYKTHVFQQYPRIRLEKKIPTEKEIREILKKTGKNSPEEELNCGACGYNSCREKAIAVYNGMAKLYMCLPYMRSKAESLSETVLKTTPNAILVLNENLEILEINKAASEMFCVKEDEIKQHFIDEIFNDVSNYIDVLKTKNNIIEQIMDIPKYDITVKQSIYYLKDEHLIISIYSDISEKIRNEKTARQVKEKTIDMAHNVILNQMKVAQDIASLLGETTAQTKVILTKLVKLLESNDDI